MVLTIVDLKGQVVYHDDLSSLSLGKNHVELDLTGLQNGLYSCQLTSNGKSEANCKLLVAH